MLNIHSIQFHDGPLDGLWIHFPWGVAAPSELLHASGDVLDFDQADGLYRLCSDSEGGPLYSWEPTNQTSPK